MNNVTPLNKNSANNLVGDFQKQNIKFDIDKLRNACNEVLKIKGFDTSLGIPHSLVYLLIKYQVTQTPLKEIKLEVYIGQNLMQQV